MEFSSPKELYAFNKTPLGDTGCLNNLIIYWLLKNPVF